MDFLRMFVSAVVLVWLLLGSGPVHACNYYEDTTAHPGGADHATGTWSHPGTHWDSDTFSMFPDKNRSSDRGFWSEGKSWGHGLQHGVFGSGGTHSAGHGHQDFDGIKDGWHGGFPPCGPTHPGGPDDGCTPVNPVPEPGTMVLLGFGLLGLARFGRKRLKS